MLALAGSRAYYRTVGHGVAHCERCGGDRPYRQRSGRRWFQLLGIPVVPGDSAGEHLRCTVCRTCYRVDLLAVPTVEQMRVALRAATTAAALAMLWAGGKASPAARQRAVELIMTAGSPEYCESQLAVALAAARPVAAASLTCGPVPGLKPAIETFAIQLEAQAAEWFLARVLQVGLADGALSAVERDVAGTIARYLGMTRARARDVISVAEAAAQAG
ncbi:MAG TPA: hypothetical protein VNF47_16710 [Streptosporangiaceae bacterium]|nr:hypothetical protein [Streptosporangiaceae bacterium]